MKAIRVTLIVVVAFFVILQILFLRPARLEKNEGSAKRGMFKDLASMIQAKRPNDEVRYTIQKLHYTAVEGEAKQWEIEADTAFLYNDSQQVLANNVRIRMFDPGGKITIIVGREARYAMDSKDFDIKDDVTATFPDGFWIKTEVAHYSSKTGIVSTQEPFRGASLPGKSDLLEVWGRGFEAPRAGPVIKIFAETHARIHRSSDGEISDVRSDKANIDRFSHVTEFFMNQQTDFVNSDLGSLHVRSKKQEAKQGEEADQNSNAKSESGRIQYLIAREDVLIRETDVAKSKNGLKYATCQRADFIAKENKIVLTGFPSAYQQFDTVTGEVITIYRGKNLVEVNQANGYHEGNEEKSPQQQEARSQ